MDQDKSNGFQEPMFCFRVGGGWVQIMLHCVQHAAFTRVKDKGLRITDSTGYLGR